MVCVPARPQGMVAVATPSSFVITDGPPRPAMLKATVAPWSGTQPQRLPLFCDLGGAPCPTACACQALQAEAHWSPNYDDDIADSEYIVKIITATTRGGGTLSAGQHHDGLWPGHCRICYIYRCIYIQLWLDPQVWTPGTQRLWQKVKGIFQGGRGVVWGHLTFSHRVSPTLSTAPPPAFLLPCLCLHR